MNFQGVGIACSRHRQNERERRVRNRPETVRTHRILPNGQSKRFEIVRLQRAQIGSRRHARVHVVVHDRRTVRCFLRTQRRRQRKKPHATAVLRRVRRRRKLENDDDHTQCRDDLAIVFRRAPPVRCGRRVRRPRAGQSRQTCREGFAVVFPPVREYGSCVGDDADRFEPWRRDAAGRRELPQNQRHQSEVPVVVTRPRNILERIFFKKENVLTEINTVESVLKARSQEKILENVFIEVISIPRGIFLWSPPSQSTRTIAQQSRAAFAYSVLSIVITDKR